MNTPVAKNILIMAGGTGGHVYPALATAEELIARGCHVEWLGTRRGIEARLVPEAGIKLHYLSVNGLRGKGLLSLLKAPFMLLLAISQALNLCLRYRPACVLGMGGFASGPGGLSAWMLRRPLVIQEQNAVPGTTNRILARFADRVLEGFEGAFDDSRAEFTGNPVRKSIIESSAQEIADTGALRLLVVGGSLGASILNEVVPAALGKLSQHERPQVWHQSGPTQFDAAAEHYQQAGVEARLVPYIDDMSQAYAWADIVVCRAGALTVTELAAAGVASLLIPYPHAIDDHQTRNGEWLASRGGALVLDQRKFETEKLVGLLKGWISNRDQLLAMGKRAAACAQPLAAQKVAMACLEVARG